MRAGTELVRGLKRRRTGADRYHLLDAHERASVLVKQLGTEAYETRARGPFTQFALGAMEPVDADYTRISIETADRVEAQLARRLAVGGFSVVFRRQGSVPLNVHIRGVSDVDLLTIETRSLFYSPAGPRAARGEYPPAAVQPVELLAALRRQCESDLESAFPAATVGKTGSRAVKISGGSLPRVVDVVPAVWSDTSDYQATYDETHRAVSIYDKDTHSTIKNMPFLYMHRIDARCRAVAGSLRKAIRLCKNLKAELEDEGRSFVLSSYEIAGLMYHAEQPALLAGATYPLAILAEAQRHFDALYFDRARARTLMTPDGSRTIVDSDRKFESLQLLSHTLDALLVEVAREQDAALAARESVLREDYRRAVSTLRL